MLCDSRDVVLQANPFDRMPRGLATGAEERLIGECSLNSRWIERVYGRQVLETLAPERILCSGVTLGSREAILRYLDDMCTEITQLLSVTAFTGALDQAVHNKLLHGGRLRSLQLLENGCDQLATLHYSSPLKWKFDPQGKLLADSGKPVAIVHQYDRHSSIAERLRGASVTSGAIESGN